MSAICIDLISLFTPHLLGNRDPALSLNAIQQSVPYTVHSKNVSDISYHSERQKETLSQVTYCSKTQSENSFLYLKPQLNFIIIMIMKDSNHVALTKQLSISHSRNPMKTLLTV